MDVVAEAFDTMLRHDEPAAPLHPDSPPVTATPAQIGAFLAALSVSGRDQDAEVLARCAGVLRRHAVRVEVAGAIGGTIVDIVGTGGDGFDTFNASTAAAVVVAGCGVAVAKVGTVVGAGMFVRVSRLFWIAHTPHTHAR